MAYQYNAASVVTRLTYADSSYVAYTLDGANRIRFATHSSGASLYGQSFNSLGQRGKLTWGRQRRQRGLHLGPCRQAGDDDRRPGGTAIAGPRISSSRRGRRGRRCRSTSARGWR
ncbi:MAG: hypothetical protein WDN06_05580 [Asticcacaulis sp.]